MQLNHLLERYSDLAPVNLKVVTEQLEGFLIDEMSLELELEILEDP